MRPRLANLRAAIRGVPDVLSASILQNYRYAQHHVRTVALFAVIGEPVFYFAWRSIDPGSYENLPLRLVGAFLSMPLVFAPIAVRARHERRFAVLFLVAATYVLPFAFCFLLLQNARFAGQTGTTPIQWPMQYTVSLILLVLLFPSGLLAGLMFVIATACAWALFAMNGGGLSSEVYRVFWEFMPIYLFVLVAG